MTIREMLTQLESKSKVCFKGSYYFSLVFSKKMLRLVRQINIIS